MKNVEAQTSARQTVSASRQYDAFGNLDSTTGTFQGPFGYGGGLGYQSDSDSGLQLLGHRYYDPSVGRFLTRDPVKDGRNWYGYCGNNPTAFADPAGLRKWGWPFNGGVHNILPEESDYSLIIITEGPGEGWTWGFYDEGTGTSSWQDADWAIVTDRKGQPVKVCRIRAGGEIWIGQDQEGNIEIEGNHPFSWYESAIVNIDRNNGAPGTYPDLGQLKRDISRLDILKPCYWE